MADVESFVSRSPLASRVRLPMRIVICRSMMSPSDIAALGGADEYRPEASGERVCEIEAGGQVVARGRIVRRRGGYFFQVEEVASLGEAKREDRA